MKKSKLILLPIFAMSLGMMTGCDSQAINNAISGVQSQIDGMQSDINDLKNQVNNLKTQIATLEGEMSASIAGVEADYKKKIADIEADISALQKKINDLTAQLVSDKEALENDYNSKINKVKSDYDAELAALKTNYDKQLADLAEDYKDRIEELKEEYDANLATITANYDNQLATLVANYDNQLANIKTDYNTKLNNVQATYDLKVAEIEANIASANAAISALQAELAAQIAAIQNEYSPKINDLTSRVAELEKVQSHTVTFDTNGGGFIPSAVVIHGEKIKKPADPSKVGSIFKGWTYEDEPWSFIGYVVTEDMTLVANWEEIDYTATFRNDDGTVLQTIEKVHYGETVEYTGPTPIKPNPSEHYLYTFKGWDKELKVVGEMIFTAQYEATFAPFTVVFQDEGGQELYRTYVAEYGEQGVPKVTWEEALQGDYYSIPFGMDMEKWSTSKEYKWTYDNVGLNEVVTLAVGAKIGSSGAYSLFNDDGTQKVKVYINGNEVPLANTLTYEQSGLNTYETRYMPLCSFELPVGENTIELVFQQDSGYRLYIGEEVRLYRSNVYLDDGVQPVESLFEGELPTKAAENHTMYQFKHWVKISDENDTIIFRPAFESCTEGLVFDGTMVYQYEGESTEVHVPGTWGGKMIKTISERSFQSTAVERVYIADGINTIEEQAFSYCSKLEEIQFPSTLKTIKEHAFEYCSVLKEITLPEGVNDVRRGAFTDCIGLKAAHLPDSLTTISNNCFWNCRCMEVCDIPSTVTMMDMGAFLGCKSLKEINIPQGVTRLYNGCFAECLSLTQVIIPNSVQSIDEAVFRNCDSLAYVFIPTSVDRIDDGAFNDDYGLTVYAEASKKPKNWSANWNAHGQVVWSSTGTFTEGGYTYATYVENEAKCANVISFSHDITEFAPPASVNGYTINSISRIIFKGHENLTSALLPPKTDYITADCFADCPSLTFNEFGNSLYLGSGDNPYFALIKAKNKNITSCEVHADCRVMAEEAFMHCDYLVDVTINNGITAIPKKAFYYDERIQTLNIPGSVKTIGTDAFHGCTSLVTLVLNEGLEKIGWAAFDYSFSINAVTIPSTVKEIGESAFSQCYGLRSFTFLSPEPPVIGEYLIMHVWDDHNNPDFRIYIPKGSLDAYKSINVETWQRYAVSILVEVE